MTTFSVECLICGAVQTATRLADFQAAMTAHEAQHAAQDRQESITGGSGALDAER